MSPLNEYVFAQMYFVEFTSLLTGPHRMSAKEGRGFVSFGFCISSAQNNEGQPVDSLILFKLNK